MDSYNVDGDMVPLDQVPVGQLRAMFTSQSTQFVAMRNERNFLRNLLLAGANAQPDVVSDYLRSWG